MEVNEIDQLANEYIKYYLATLEEVAINDETPDAIQNLVQSKEIVGEIIQKLRETNEYYWANEMAKHKESSSKEPKKKKVNKKK